MQFSRVPTFKTLLALSLLAATSLQAGEIAIEAKPFEILSEFDATVMPAEGIETLRLSPQEWQSFSIVSLAAHGQTVKKGDALVRFDTRDIDRQIENTKQSITQAQLGLEETRESLAQLKETAAHRIEAAKRAAQVAAENHDYFTKTGRKAEEEESAQQVEQGRQRLENEKEELRQLQKMYAADQATEETEEIILTRQKDSVKTAEFYLRVAQLQHERKTTVLLPRMAIDLANAKRDTAIAQRYAETEIPRGIQQAEAKLKSLETQLQRQQLSLTNLEKDRGLFEIKASAAGVFYHGLLENGKWTTGDSIRSLHVGGQLPLERVFACLIPASAPLEFAALVNAGTARRLNKDLTGIAQLHGKENTEIPVSILNTTVTPNTEGNYLLRLKATWPKELAGAISTGNPARIRLVAHRNPKAIVIPEKALSYGSSGWQVKVKLADGKTEARSVKRGLQQGDEVEILSGLEAGQVIVTP